MLRMVPYLLPPPSFFSVSYIPGFCITFSTRKWRSIFDEKDKSLFFVNTQKFKLCSVILCGQMGRTHGTPFPSSLGLVCRFCCFPRGRVLLNMQSWNFHSILHTVKALQSASASKPCVCAAGCTTPLVQAVESAFLHANPQLVPS